MFRIISPSFYISKFLRTLYICRLKKYQGLHGTDLKEIQEKRLRKIVRNAYDNVPFYTDLYNSLKIQPSDIRTIEDLKKIPILTKRNVQENYPIKLLARNVNPKKIRTVRTTGSTGTPLEICFSYPHSMYLMALKDYIFLELGVKWYESIITIRHYPPYSGNLESKRIYFLTRKNISIFEPIDKIEKMLNKIKPDIILSFPSILDLLAEKVKKSNYQCIKPRLILTTGEALTNSIREKIRDTFGAEVLGIYGAEEFGSFAFECLENNGYHLISDSVIAEVIRENENVETGKEGELVLTNLYNDVMPLIRYNLGDVVSLSRNRCSCGRGYPLIKNIEGRKDDFLTLPSGKLISPRLINTLEDIKGVSMYKIIQEKRDHIVVNLVRNQEFNKKTIGCIKDRIMAGCQGESVIIEVKYVDELPRNRRGKLRAVISNVSK